MKTPPHPQIAFITGGAQGIGKAVAHTLHQRDITIVSLDRDHERNLAMVAELKNRAFAYTCDIAQPTSVANAFAQAEKDIGCPAILVNSAGIAGSNAPTLSYSLGEWEEIIKINLTGTLLANRAVLPSMVKNNYGRIVNIASIAGKEGNPKAAAYSASKAGVIALTKSLGKEFADKNIAINCVTPAAARTQIFDQMSQEHIAYMLAKIPRGRFVEPTEIANMIAWLVSPENSFTTAAAFDLSGGRATY